VNLVRNERLKLFATCLNGLAIAIFAIGGVAPSFSYFYDPAPEISALFVTSVSSIYLLALIVLPSSRSFALRGLRP